MKNGKAGKTHKFLVSKTCGQCPRGETSTIQSERLAEQLQAKIGYKAHTCNKYNQVRRKLKPDVVRLEECVKENGKEQIEGSRTRKITPATDMLIMQYLCEDYKVQEIAKELDRDLELLTEYIKNNKANLQKAHTKMMKHGGLYASAFKTKITYAPKTVTI